MRTRERHEHGTDWPQRVHLLGAGGAGVSGIGRILATRGIQVTGHDRAPSQTYHVLEQAGVALTLGESHADLLPGDTELVVRSVAVPSDDPQVLRAQERGIPVAKYSEVLRRLASPSRTLAVAGTHGKTTASWMLWYALEGIAEARGGAVAGALIGGLCRKLGVGALAGSSGGWFCVEACEYDRTFLQLSPRGAIVTNVEGDHLDYYHTLENVERAFASFLDEVASDGLIVLGRDVPETVELGGRDTEIWRLGRELEVDLLGEETGCFRFRLRGPGWATRPVQLAVPGHFNVENAALALALAVGLSAQLRRLDPAELVAGAAAGIEKFAGVHRRFEPWGSEAGVDVVHDYAHHPTEVRVTIEAALRAYPGRPLHVLFQPHQHSRTSRFLEEFAESLRASDRVVVSDVYGARLHIDGESYAGSQELVEALARRDVLAIRGGSLADSVERLVDGLTPLGSPAVALVLGAGDVEDVRDNLLFELASRSSSRDESPRRA